MTKDEKLAKAQELTDQMVEDSKKNLGLTISIAYKSGFFAGVVAGLKHQN